MAVTTLKIFHVIVLIIYAVATVVFSVLSLNRTSGSSDAAIDIVDNWKTRAILDIAVAENCPQGFEEAFNYTWPGNNAGCSCKNISRFSQLRYKTNEGIFTGICSANQTQAGCKDVRANPAAQVNSWGRVNSTRVKICVLRSNETWADVAPKSGANCTEQGARKCGTNPDTAFCTFKDKCPINDINITSVDLNTNFAALASCTYNKSCLVLTRDNGEVKFLTFKRADNRSDTLPLAQMRLNEYAMCKTGAQDNITPNRTDFELLTSKRSTCNNEGEALWRTEDNMTEADLFSRNRLTPVIEYLDQFGYYPERSSGRDYNWGLYSRSYVPWKAACRGEMSALVARSHGVKSLKVAQIIQLVVAAIVNFILGIILPCFILSGSKPTFTKVFNWVGKLIQVPFQIITMLIANSIYKFFAGFVLQGCSDPAVTQILTDMGIGAGLAYDETVKGLVFFVLAILFDIGCFIYKKVKGEEEEVYYPQVDMTNLNKGPKGPPRPEH